MTRLGESPSQEQRDATSAANRARQQAVRRLIANHASEYEEIHLEEREKLGLGPRDTIAGLRDRVAALEAELVEAKRHGDPVGELMKELSESKG